ncbi:MAG: hypothetical protein K9L17_06555 [Clostridiales bacterium]|nr:hypothetical protein [Clostridiales bacterium]MCF8022333.1 hypothetical protein [Clostridiales bacterium]
MLGELSHLIGINATFIVQIINLIILLTIPLVFITTIGVIIYVIITLNKLKQRIEKLEEELNKNNH